MARDHRGLVEQGLRLKKTGNRIVTLLGGREIHPVSVAVGGFYRVPTENELQVLGDDLKWALDASLAAVRQVAAFDFPDFEQDYEFVALSHPREYPFNEGRLVSNKGLDIDVADYEDHFVEQHVKHSNALHSLLRERGSYLVGPLARFNLNFSRLPDVAQQAARECGLAVPCRNPFRSIVVRAIEMVFACWEALRVLREYRQPASPRADVPVRAGAGCAATEAPRGTLYHRYEIDDRGSDSPRQNRAADFPEPEAHRRRSLALRFATGQPPERRSHLEVRAGDTQLRSMHLLRHSLLAAPGRAGVTVLILGCGNPDRCRRRRRPPGRPQAPRTGDTRHASLAVKRWR